MNQLKEELGQNKNLGRSELGRFNRKKYGSVFFIGLAFFCCCGVQNPKTLTTPSLASLYLRPLSLSSAPSSLSLCAPSLCSTAANSSLMLLFAGSYPLRPTTIAGGERR